MPTAVQPLSRQFGQAAPAWLRPLFPWIGGGLAMLAVFAGSLVLYIALERKQDTDIAQTVRAGAEGAKNQIEVRMESRYHALARMAQDWELAGAPAQYVWEANAASYIRDVPDAQALEWIDASRHVRWIVPRAGNEAELTGLAQDKSRSVAMDQALRENQPVVTGLVSLQTGGLGFIIYAPIMLRGQSGGFLAAVLRAEDCLQRYLPAPVGDGEAITVSERGRVFFTRAAGAPPLRQEWVVPERIELNGATWNLRMWPTPRLAARLDSPLPAVVLCAGTLVALLLGAVSYYAQRSARQAAETTRANGALRSALLQVKTLEGLLPICCYCKRVRDDTGYWSQIDTYLHKHTNASLSHGYCPECAAKFYEECGLDVPDKLRAEIEEHNYD